MRWAPVAAAAELLAGAVRLAVDEEESQQQLAEQLWTADEVRVEPGSGLRLVDVAPERPVAWLQTMGDDEEIRKRERKQKQCSTLEAEAQARDVLQLPYKEAKRSVTWGRVAEDLKYILKEQLYLLTEPSVHITWLEDYHFMLDVVVETQGRVFALMHKCSADALKKFEQSVVFKQTKSRAEQKEQSRLLGLVRDDAEETADGAGPEAGEAIDLSDMRPGDVGFCIRGKLVANPKFVARALAMIGGRGMSDSVISGSLARKGFIKNRLHKDDPTFGEVFAAVLDQLGCETTTEQEVDETAGDCRAVLRQIRQDDFQQKIESVKQALKEPFDAAKAADLRPGLVSRPMLLYGDVHETWRRNTEWLLATAGSAFNLCHNVVVIADLQSMDPLRGEPVGPDDFIVRALETCIDTKSFLLFDMLELSSAASDGRRSFSAKPLWKKMVERVKEIGEPTKSLWLRLIARIEAQVARREAMEFLTQPMPPEVPDAPRGPDVEAAQDGPAIGPAAVSPAFLKQRLRHDALTTVLGVIDVFHGVIHASGWDGFVHGHGQYWLLWDGRVHPSWHADEQFIVDAVRRSNHLAWPRLAKHELRKNVPYVTQLAWDVVGADSEFVGWFLEHRCAPGVDPFWKDGYTVDFWLQFVPAYERLKHEQEERDRDRLLDDDAHEVQQLARARTLLQNPISKESQVLEALRGPKAHGLLIEAGGNEVHRSWRSPRFTLAALEVSPKLFRVAFCEWILSDNSYIMDHFRLCGRDARKLLATLLSTSRDDKTHSLRGACAKGDAGVKFRQQRDEMVGNLIHSLHDDILKAIAECRVKRKDLFDAMAEVPPDDEIPAPRATMGSAAAAAAALWAS